MKRIWLLLVACLLFGCAQSTLSLQERFEAELDFVKTLESIDGKNTKEFYSYYVEPSIGKLKSNRSNNVFTKEGVQFVMNLNVSKIVSEKYYTDTITSQDVTKFENLLFVSRGQYEDISLNIYDYECEVYQYEGLLMVFMKTQFMNFYAVGNENQLISIAGEMLKIARTVKVRPDEIISAYSSKEAIQYKKEALNLFEVAIPESGRVDEMISDITGIDPDVGNDTPIDDNYQSDNFGDKIPTPTPYEDQGEGDDYASDSFGTADN